MPRAVLRNGLIYPVEPLPKEWEDGKELFVEPAPETDPEFVDRWYAEMERLCADSAPEEEAQLQAALDEIRNQGKQIMRRKMELPE
jgi:hypothetical protein